MSSISSLTKHKRTKGKAPLKTPSTKNGNVVNSEGAIQNEEEVEEKPPTFITVLYGKNQRAIFNTHCKSRALIEHIRRKCKCTKTATLELMNGQGQMHNLLESQSRSNREYAYERSGLLSRGEYVLIIVEQRSTEQPTRYVSVMDNLVGTHPGLSQRLEELNAEAAEIFAAEVEAREKLKKGADENWELARKSVSQTAQTRHVVRVLQEHKRERRTSRGSRGSISLDRRKSQDLRKEESRNKSRVS